MFNKKRLRVGIIGCGTIGSQVACAIERQLSRHAGVAYLCDLKSAQALSLKKKLTRSSPEIVSFQSLIDKSDFIVETASTEAAAALIRTAWKQGKDILILSVGGLLKARAFLSGDGKRGKGTLYVPSGAIAGVDAVLAARAGKIRSVKITTRKPLRSLQGSPFFLRNKKRFAHIRKPTLIFEGSAAQAIRFFPENINVAATLSLAGIGPERTRVRIFASPADRVIRHEIEVKGSFGHIVSHITNKPSIQNPKTSRLAVASTIATLEKIFSPIKIGT